MWNFDGRVAMVTGAGNGIGSATAVLLARAGAQLIAVDIEEEPLRKTCQCIRLEGGTSLPFVLDIADASAVQHAVETTVRKLGAIDILFANAAIQMVKPAAEMNEAEWDRLLDVNLKGLFLCCRAVIPSMRARQSGAIVISASGHAFATYRGFSGYAATKGAAVAFMRGLALDYAADGIRVNCVIPGATETRLLQSYFNESADPASARTEMLDRIPMHRLATPEDVGQAALFLASDCASYITGTCLAVDGGLMAQG